MKKRLLVIGAGAIGRGHLPWVFSPDDFEYYFIDRNKDLVNELKRRGSYTTYAAGAAGYVKRTVAVSGAFLSAGDMPELNGLSLAVMAVGPRNVVNVARDLSGFEGTVLCAENDPETVNMVRYLCKKARPFFAIPDVITSNTASQELQDANPLNICTEQGVFYTDERAFNDLPSSAMLVKADELKRQWIAKLYLHNTPHCIAAYLGSLLGLQFLHEGMSVSSVREVVEGAMDEMKEVVTSVFGLDSAFSEWYASKEIGRFTNPLLNDPIIRVAREPLRKLEPDGRLLGAAQLCMSMGLFPKNIMLGITAAISYSNTGDEDRHIGMLKDSLELGDLLSVFLGLKPHNPLHLALVKAWGSNTQRLKEIANDRVI
jgi:mannitol-1-phosphate/altronate dehydrogenase